MKKVIILCNGMLNTGKHKWTVVCTCTGDNNSAPICGSCRKLAMFWVSRSRFSEWYDGWNRAYRNGWWYDTSQWWYLGFQCCLLMVSGWAIGWQQSQPFKRRFFVSVTTPGFASSLKSSPIQMITHWAACWLHGPKHLMSLPASVWSGLDALQPRHKKSAAKPN